MRPASTSCCSGGWHRPGRWVLSNDEVADIVARHPDRFSGIAALDLERPTATLAEPERAITVLGFKGLRVIPWLWDRPPDHRLYYPLHAKCVELGVPFCTQVAYTGPAMASEPGRPVPYLDRVALEFPQLTIVGGHIGHAWTEEMIGLAWKHDNVFIDTSAYAPRYYPPSLQHFASTHGQDKVLFGTNFPQLPGLGKALRWAKVRALDLPLARAKPWATTRAACSGSS